VRLDHGTTRAEGKVTMRFPHTRRCPNRLVAALATFAFTLGLARVASAQNVTLAFSPSQPNPNWLDTHGAPLPLTSLRPLSFNPYGISFSDCESDSQLQFPVVVQISNGTSGQDTLQAWAGTIDCTETTNRGSVGGVSGTCIPVSAPVVLSGSSVVISIYARDLAMAIGGISPAGTGGVANFTSVHASGDASCFRQESSAAVPFGLYFLAFTNGGATIDTSLSYNAPVATGSQGTNGMLIDLVGPIAPGGGTITTSDRELKLSWAPSTDSDTQGFDVFCDPPPGSESLLNDGGALFDAGLQGVADPNALECQSPLATANERDGSQIPAAYVCGPPIQGATSNQFVSSSLTNGVQYTYAVAGFDAFDNIGAVDVIGCADLENTSGGTAGGAAGGGGGCAITGGAPSSSLAASLGLAFAALVLASRKRGRRA
jgi:hypothetical protein